MASADDSDDGWDDFMDQFTQQRYKNGFAEDNWEEVLSRNTCKTFFYISLYIFVTYGIYMVALIVVALH